MLSGLVPVPVPPPYRDIDLDRMFDIARHSGCRTIVAGNRGKGVLTRRLERRGNAGEFQVVEVDRDTLCLRKEDAAGLFRERRIDGRDSSLLQYTSGSTGQPRGVVLSHDNIISNQRMIARAFNHSSKTIVSGWLPPYHDMGLIGLVMQPLFLGCECILMSPAEFVKNPFRWLQVISEYRVTTSGGPNFAYDLCVERVDESRVEMLDLSCWQVAFNGSEKVRESTIDRFERKFSRCGFRREAIFPCYGLAEASLFASGGPSGRRPVVAHLDSSSLQKGFVVASDGHGKTVASVVSCGFPAEETAVLIADPDTMQELEAGRVGEVWIQSPSVANGYWGTRMRRRSALRPSPRTARAPSCGQATSVS
jgi:acyl-CoA synthetase (AMP-forming)/AMP-acid ligase II